MREQPNQALPLHARKNRQALLFLVFCLCISGLVGRLYYWQIAQHGRLSTEATLEHVTPEKVYPSRGLIYSADGILLASNIVLDTVGAVPAQVKDPVATASVVATILALPFNDVLDKLTQQRASVLIKRKITPQQSKKLTQLNLAGIFLQPETKRAYPQGTMLSQVLGFTNLDNEGQYGVEGYYNSIIGGKPGLLTVETDIAGNPLAIGERQWLPPQPGSNLYLTIDTGIQHLAELELKKTVAKHRATGGEILIMNPKTGAIMAMASMPNYNPNDYNTVTNQSLFVNPSVGRLYEPGSTFKVLTMATGLQQHAITPNTAFEDTGEYHVADRVIHNWNLKGNGWETMTQVLQHSANVGAAWAAHRIGRQGFYSSINSFGFGTPTGVDLQGEEHGLVRDSKGRFYSPVDLATNAFGQGISVTPLQLTTAVGALANHGVLMKPYVVSRIQNGAQAQINTPTEVRQVISPETAQTITDMIVTSAVDGEAQLALVPGYQIAAKTGTASIPELGGTYSPSQTIASVIGYAPANDPQFVMLVKIDRPQDIPWGSEVAAPAWGELASQLFVYLKIPPDQTVASAPR